MINSDIIKPITKGAIYLLLFFLSLPVAFTQVNIIIPDTVINRGINHRENIYLTGSLGSTAIKSIKIILTYNSKALDINSVFGGDKYQIRCDAPVIARSYPSADSSIVEISCDSIATGSGDTICGLKIEGLAGPDSVGYIKVTGLVADGKKDTTFSQKTGIIKVLGAPIFPIPSEGLGQNYPNPFDYNTKMDLSLKKAGRVVFSVFNSLGRLADRSDSDDPVILYKIIMKDGTEKAFPTDGYLSAGNYTILMTPMQWKMASGSYYLFMKTDNGLYSIGLIYNK